MSEAPGVNADGSRLPTLGPRGEGWFLLQVLLLIAIFAAALLGKGAWSGAFSFVTAVVGGAMMLVGFLLAYRSIRDLDRSLSPMPRPIDSAELIQTGAYRWLRHPIYAALILICAGGSLLVASLISLGLTLVLAVVLDLKARREEVWLRERYPGYMEYAAHTKKFVPGIY